MFTETLDQWKSSTTNRERFIVRSYQHLLLAVLTFVGIEYYLFSSGIAESIYRFVIQFNWLMILGAYMVVSWGATRAAWRVQSKNGQYAALFLFVLAKAFIFVPLLYTADAYFPGVIESAVTATLVGFAGLTFIAFQTRKDFSFLGGFLRWGFFIALCLIIAGALGFLQLGAWFSIGMIGFAGAAILYDTSKILHHYPDTKYISAGLELFSSITLMLWYMIQAMGHFSSGGD